MAEKRQLTDRFLRSLSPAKHGTRNDVWDTVVPTFGACVYDDKDSDPSRRGKAGRIAFIMYTRFKRGAAPARRIIGTYGAITLEDARRTAGEWRSLIAKGIDPGAVEKAMLASPDQQISLTDPDSRSMATSGRGSGVVGYNVQVAVDTEHHLIVTHEVTNSGSDRAQLANMAKQAKAVLKTETLEAVADRGYFSSLEILACHEAGITVTLPKPQTSGAKSDGRFGKQDFVYLPEEDTYRCPAGEQLPYRFTSEEDGKRLRRYWTTACQDCSLKSQCTTGPERRIPRWEHEHLLEAVQQRLDASPQAMRQRRETVEHPFGTMKARMGATHFLTKTLRKVAAEMALSVLAYNLTRVMNIVGTKPLMDAIVA